jgi:cell division protein FtsW (lipid II flippase)
MWVNLKILPNTWLTLPFISYGGTAMMVNIIEIVLLYKITKE